MTSHRARNGSITGDHKTKSSVRDMPYLCRDKMEPKKIPARHQRPPSEYSNYLPNDDDYPDLCDDEELTEATCPPAMTKSLVPYSSACHREVRAPLKRSMSFLTTQELFSYRAIPAAGVLAYLGTAVGTIAHHETFVE